MAALSLVCDLGMGQPLGHGLRVCCLAVGLGEQLELPAAELRVVYYSSMLRWIGCTANAHEVAGALGDDLSSRSDMATLDQTRPDAMATFARTHGYGPAGAMVQSPEGWRSLASAHCEAAVLLGRWLELDPAVQNALDQVFERWDGKGLPRGLGGAELSPAARLTRVAGDLELLQRVHGIDAAVAATRERAGSMYDPELAAALAAEAPALLAELSQRSAWETALGAEPGPWEQAEGVRLERVLEAMADFADLKAPCFTGHSRGVCGLAREAATVLGLGTDDRLALGRAALVQDVGRVGVSNAIWEKRGYLDDSEREAIRLQPYLTERALARSPWLQQLSDLAASHHERLDGSGYHRRLDARSLSLQARLLAAADVYQAMSEPRPHRPALEPERAAGELRAEAARGRLDPAAVEAVLTTAGHATERPRGPQGLTPRELEVLKLLSVGLRNREIAERMIVSPKTIGRHLENIYAKLGVSTRAAATLQAMQQGLLPASAPSKGASAQD